MDKITFEHFAHIMAHDISKKVECIEIWFCIEDNDDYYSSWLGKMMDKDTKSTCYWFGLTEGGSQAYEYDTFEQFANAKVFCNKSIKEIWNSVSLFSIDGCDIKERLPFYLDFSDNSK